MTNYEKLVEALRCGEYKPECGSSDCPYWSGLGCMDGQLMEDAADAIEDLQRKLTMISLELPKRGEWIIHGEPPMLVIECSVCGQKYFNHVMQEKAKYCSMCGAKMEVQE